MRLGAGRANGACALTNLPLRRMGPLFDAGSLGVYLGSHALLSDGIPLSYPGLLAHVARDRDPRRLLWRDAGLVGHRPDDTGPTPMILEAWVFYVLTAHVVIGGDVRMEVEQSRQFPTEVACKAALWRVEQAYPGSTLECRNIAPPQR